MDRSLKTPLLSDTKAPKFIWGLLKIEALDFMSGVFVLSLNRLGYGGTRSVVAVIP